MLDQTVVTPLVTVICLSYRQAAYIRTTVESVLAQDYPNIELWLADDASDDGSQKICHELAEEYPLIKLHLNMERQGNCKTINDILPMVQGKYLVDLAADDQLLPTRIRRGVEVLEECNESIGVQFTNAFLMDTQGRRFGTHFPVDEKGKVLESVPDGDVYTEVIRRYFINPVSMMIRTSLLREIGGYDPGLSFEDFDFWVRSARVCHYKYTDEILVSKRIVPGSYSSRQYRWNSPQFADTFRICEKIRLMNRTVEEQQALKERLYFEMRQCIRTANLALFCRYVRLLSRL